MICDELFIGCSDHFAEQCVLPKGHAGSHSSVEYFPSPASPEAGAEPGARKIEQAQNDRRDRDYAKEHGLDVDEMRKVGAEPKAEGAPLGTASSGYLRYCDDVLKQPCGTVTVVNPRQIGELIAAAAAMTEVGGWYESKRSMKAMERLQKAVRQIVKPAAEVEHSGGARLLIVDAPCPKCGRQMRYRPLPIGDNVCDHCPKAAPSGGDGGEPPSNDELLDTIRVGMKTIIDDKKFIAGLEAIDTLRSRLAETKPTEPVTQPLSQEVIDHNKYGPERPKAVAQPGAGGAEGLWVIVYDDPEHDHEIFMGAGAEQAARKRYAVAKLNWTCHLLCEAPVSPAEPVGSAEEFYMANWSLLTGEPLTPEQCEAVVKFTDAYAAHVTQGLKAELFQKAEECALNYQLRTKHFREGETLREQLETSKISGELWKAKKEVAEQALTQAREAWSTREIDRQRDVVVVQFEPAEVLDKLLTQPQQRRRNESSPHEKRNDNR